MLDNIKLDNLVVEIALGEDSRRQFKADIRNSDSLAADMAAFANAEGGTIFIGVKDDGTLPGLTPKDVTRLNQLISNAASQHVRSPLSVRTETIQVATERIVIRLIIPKGLDKPCLQNDRNGSSPSS
jgi:ATP-dependent DNA helicase RecG